MKLETELYSLEFPQLTRCVFADYYFNVFFSHEYSCKNLHNKANLQKCKNTNAHGMMLQKYMVKLKEHKPVKRIKIPSYTEILELSHYKLTSLNMFLSFLSWVFFRVKTMVFCFANSFY